MATLQDVRRIALGLPGVVEGTSYGSGAWKVGRGAIAWERPLRKSDLLALGEGAPDGVVLGVRVTDVGVKEALIADEPDVFFTTPHFDGYAAVLVRLEAIGAAELEELLVEAWLERAPKRAAKAYLAQREAHG